MPTTQPRRPRAPQDRKPKQTAAADEPIVLTVDGKQYVCPNKDDLTIEETILIEDATGQDLDSLKGVRTIAALLWIAMRREVPTVTWQDVIGMPWSALQGNPEAEATPVPTAAVSTRARRAATA